MSIFDRALLEAVLLGAGCGPLSVWILAFRQTYAAESLAHAMLPGLALAAVAGAPLLLGASGGVLAAALLVALAGRDRRIGTEVAIAVVVTAAFGAGALVALAREQPAPLSELLFGDLLGVSDGDLIAAGVLVVAVPAVLAALHRRLVVVAFDPASAAPLGVRPPLVQGAVLVLLAAAVVVAVQGLGNLLVLALLVAPGVAGGRLARRLGAQLAIAALAGAGSGALGLVLSDRLGLAAGASVALVATLVALTAALARPPVRATDARLRRSPLEALGGRG